MEDNQISVCNLWEVGLQENELICSETSHQQSHLIKCKHRGCCLNTCRQACEAPLGTHSPNSVQSNRDREGFGEPFSWMEEIPPKSASPTALLQTIG